MDLYFLILSFIIGTIFGSFFNVCIYRIPNKISVANPPSHCYNCNNRLKPIDLVPILSWTLLRGKCRYCGQSISSRYAFVELLTGLLFVFIYINFGYSVDTIYYCFFVSILIIITFIDIDHFIIPDGTLIIGCFFALIFNALGYGIEFVDGLKGAIFSSGLVLVCTTLIEFVVKKDVMGGGDIKLYFMIGLFLGTKLSLLTILFSIYVGGIYGIISIVYSKIRNKDFNSMIPFGPFISVASLIALVYGNQIIDLYMSLFI